MKPRYEIAGRGVNASEARQFVRERDGDSCWICHAPVPAVRLRNDPDAATLDHVIERAAGGTGDVGNLRLAHARCNHARGEAFARKHGPAIRAARRARRNAASALAYRRLHGR